MLGCFVRYDVTENFGHATLNQIYVVALPSLGFHIDHPAAITTHRHVDLGGARADPRSFSWSDLQNRLAALGRLCQS